MNFEEVNINEVEFNSLKKIEDWALLTAGESDNFNMMTITGFMYGKFFLKPMVQVYAHPERYTDQYLRENEYFTVSFFKKPKHDALQICGTKSGKEYDKLKESGLTMVPFEKVVLFDEAELVFVCKKVFHHDISKADFDSQQLLQDYYKGYTPYHTIYMGQVEKVLRHKK